MLTVDIKFLNPNVCDLSFNKKIIKTSVFIFWGEEGIWYWEKIKNDPNTDLGLYFLTLPGQDCVGKKSGASYYVVSAPSSTEVLTRYFGAKAEDFDKNRYLRHQTNADFAAIYDTPVEYCIYSASQIVEQGIEISKTPWFYIDKIAFLHYNV